MYISSILFFIRQRYKNVEHDVVELRYVRIWLNLRQVPLYMWNAKGLGIIASNVRVPIIMDR